MSRWWRAYDEALHDPKLIGLSDRLHRAWFNLLCVASKNAGLLPAMNLVAIELRVSLHKAAEYVTALVAAGLIDEIETGKFAPHNWGRRQFQSDVSTERVQQFRERRRNVSPTVSETPPETEADTETDSEADSEAETDRKEEPRARRALAPGWPADYREQFWDEFPNKVGKADAFRKLDRLARSDKVAFPTLMLALGRYRNKTDDRPFCNPTTWINGERWTDEPAAAPTRFATPPPRPGSKEDNREKTHAAIQELRGYIDAHADDARGGGDPGGANAGLLPFAKPARS